MDNSTIELLATSAVRRSIALSKRLAPVINENDKEPAWDGYIMIYADETKSLQQMRGRVPIQVKGHCVQDMSEETIKYRAEVAHLNCYKRDGGVIYFVVYISEDGEREKIYYADLTFEKLCEILAECTEDQKQKTIELSEFPTDAPAKVEILVNFEREYKPNYHRALAKEAAITSVSKPVAISPLASELVCQRLTADPENQKLIDSFQCKRNVGLAAYLKYYGWEEDCSGDKAFFLIKGRGNKVVAYFSIKCGELYEPRRIYQEFDTTCIAERVYPAIELAQFCINSEASVYIDQLRKRFCNGHTMGEMMFWLFMIPEFSKARQAAGGRYVYTYVADESAHGVLVQYHRERFHLEEPTNLMANKSVYAAGCTLMCQEIDKLMSERESFLKSLELS